MFPSLEAAAPQLLWFYEEHLTSLVMPFWLEHGLDHQCGGVMNGLGDDGRRWVEHKFTWSQGRALWTFAALHNHFDGARKWLEAADTVAHFLFACVPSEGRPWPFCFTRNGAVLDPRHSVYVEAFVLLGMAQYHRATGHPLALRLAREAARRMDAQLRQQSTMATIPHVVPLGAQAHGPLMIAANAFHELHMVTATEGWLNRARELADTIMAQHVDSAAETLYEFVRPGGGRLPGDVGGTFLPGHAIESLWFLAEIYSSVGDRQMCQQALSAMNWHMERGWDPDWGGLFLACHDGGGRPVWHAATAKLWWPHTEALYGLLLAAGSGHGDWAWPWYQRLHKYTFSTFPNRRDGDWYQNLDRYGRPIDVVVKGLRVKDPFHLPRALLKAILLLRKIVGENNTNRQ